MKDEKVKKVGKTKN
jgi:hypothetical protein